MFAFNKKKCTADTVGVIVKKKWNGHLWFLTAEYSVNGERHTIVEQLTYHVTKTHKLGIMPIGFQASSAIADIEPGAKVRVKYNPDKPKRGYLADNNGHHIS